MPNHQPNGPDLSGRPTFKQQAFLRRLAVERGVSFCPPQSKREASQVIRQLLATRKDADSDRRRETREILAAIQEGTYATAVAEHEVDGYGSTATWTGGQR